MFVPHEDYRFVFATYRIHPAHASRITKVVKEALMKLKKLGKTAKWQGVHGLKTKPELHSENIGRGNLTAPS